MDQPFTLPSRSCNGSCGRKTVRAAGISARAGIRRFVQIRKFEDVPYACRARTARRTSTGFYSRLSKRLLRKNNPREKNERISRSILPSPSFLLLFMQYVSLMSCHTRYILPCTGSIFDPVFCNMYSLSEKFPLLGKFPPSLDNSYRVCYTMDRQTGVTSAAMCDGVRELSRKIRLCTDPQ